MQKLTMIGLGAMGTAIASTLLDNSHELTVWNRSADKLKPLGELGANCTTSLSEAVEAGEILLVCIHGYEATRQLFADPAISQLLPGRTILQMSTGTPAEARAAETWVTEQGGRYLDCAIMVYPTSIGKSEAQLLFSGAEETYHQCAPFIDCLGGDIRYLGSSAGAAAALDMAVVMRLSTITVSTIYGIHLCQAEGIPLQQFVSMYPEGDRANHLAGNVESGRFDKNIAATVGTSIEVLSAIRNLAIDLGTNTELPDFLLDLYQRAAAAGHSEWDNAALINAFRSS